MLLYNSTTQQNIFEILREIEVEIVFLYDDVKS